ncbi:hypothetical protein B0I35DRAFT_250269 [Stachybotrys elegans]|uniref:Uncharacterized protein n=1 Tax=Stachybotrys elegans TaxID=80388 RepID=A0A8K0WRF4_9HYPO|nr:hypothetical protein B0I35DRAFT_250269 [Stachybotrys elegans]
MAATEPTALAIFLDTVKVIFRAVASVHWLWYLKLTSRILAWPFRILLLPLSLVFRVLLFVFSPIIALFNISLAFFYSLFHFLVSLEPLYTFFGIAASIGIAAGLVLAISSNLVTLYLGMHDDPRQDLRVLKEKGVLQDYPALRDDTSSNETEWQWLEPTPSRRRAAPGLMSQTIHEEEDDDSETAF